MKLRWILLVAMAHFLITAGASFFLLPWLLMPSVGYQDFERHMRTWEVANSLLTFPVGLLQSGLPIIPMVVNSLLWGWTIMAIVTLIRRPPAGIAAGTPADGNTVVARSFLLAVLALALFAFFIARIAGGSAVGVFGVFLIVLVATRSVVRRLAHKRRGRRGHGGGGVTGAAGSGLY